MDDTDHDAGPLRPVASTAWTLERVAESAADTLAIVDGADSRTYRQLAGDVRRAAAALRADITDLGIDIGGGRFAVLSRNSATMVELMYAASASATVMVPLNFRLAPMEIADIIADSGADLIFVESDLRPSLATIPASDHRRIVEIAEHGTTIDYAAWRDRATASDVDDCSDAARFAPAERDRVVMQMYTTGTTGRPKGVMITEGNLAAMTEMVIEAFPLDADSRYLALLPMFHVSGGGTPIGVLAAGGAVVLSSGTSATAILHDLGEHAVSHVNLVPSLISLLLIEPAITSTDLSSLRVLMYGAAPSGASVIAEAMQLLPGCSFLHGYGLTECSGGVTFADPHRWGDVDEHPGSVGRPVAGCAIRIVDPETLADVTPGAAGEVWVRSAQNTIGYWNRPEETAQLFVDGWLRTGDIGSMDGDSLMLMDRLKDMIISGGENVYSAEVENALLAHPAVFEAAVFGVADPKWGESVKAVVTLRPGSTVSPDELIEFTRSRLARYKCPKTVEIVGELPKSGSGKVLKRLLRAN